MKTRMRYYEFGGFFAIGIISVVLAVMYWLTNTTNIFIRWFLPINNSLWEMGKLMFISVLIYSVIEYVAFGRKYDNFLFSKISTLFIAPIIFVVGSYGLDLLFRNVFTITHIIVFAIAVGVGQYVSYFFMEKEYYFKLMNAFAVIALFLMLMTFLAYSNPNKSFSSPIFKPMNQYQNHILYYK